MASGLIESDMPPIGFEISIDRLFLEATCFIKSAKSTFAKNQESICNKT